MVWRRPYFNFSLRLAGFLLAGSATTLFGGDKILFSTPAERESQPIDVRSSRPNAPASINNSPATVTPGSLPIVAPRIAPRPKEDSEKNRNWLSAKPGDETPSMEDFLRTKDFNSEREKEQATFFGKPLETTVRLNPADKTEQGNQADLVNSDQRDSSRLFPSTDPSNSIQSWDSAISVNRPDLPDRPASFGDFWGHSLNSSSSPNEVRKSQISELLRSRSALDPINSLQDITRQPANPVEGIGADVFSRTQQTSLGDQWKNGGTPLTGTRPVAIENPNARALGTISTESTLKVNAPVFTKPQPAVLPFPTRPGQLFR